MRARARIGSIVTVIMVVTMVMVMFVFVAMAVSAGGLMSRLMLLKHIGLSWQYSMR